MAKSIIFENFLSMKVKEKNTLMYAGAAAVAIGAIYFATRSKIPAGLTRQKMVADLDSEVITWQEPWKTGLHNGLMQMSEKDLYSLYTLLFENHFKEITVPPTDERWQVWNKARATYAHFWPPD